MFKKIALMLLAVAMLLTGIGCSKKGSYNNFKITALKVGKADAIVLQTSKHTALIDCGEVDDSDKILDYLSENDVVCIDYMFISHFDKDHVGGAAEVINNIPVNNVITPDYTEDSDEYNSFIKALKDKGIEQSKATASYKIKLDDAEFTIYPAATIDDKNTNDNSLAISITHGDNSFLFAGDAESDRLEEIIEQTGQEYTFLKVPHHGVYDDELPKFLDVVKPKYAIICCSDKNTADKKTIKALEKVNCQVYTTQDENITINSNGTKIDLQHS